MELHQLRYFCAVARAGNFTRAAVAQHVAQPSLSQQILKLESELGARLFDRLPRSARLTQFGRAFLPRAEAILRQVGEARTEIQEMAGSEKGGVAIGAIPTIAPYFLPAVLTSFAREHPSVAVSVVEEITPVLLEHLRNGGIDLALLALPVPGDDLYCQVIFSEPLYAALPTGHALASRRGIDLKEMKNEAFLLLKEGHCFRANAITACRRSRVKPRVVFESGQFSTILAMVAAGMGVSIVPAMAVEKRKDCRFVPLRDQQAIRNVGLVELKHRCPTRAQQALVQHLKKANENSLGSL
jgi:LysR family transcriptional regulator, hydrogen peroxide-inducible genes activator